MELAYMASI